MPGGSCLGVFSEKVKPICLGWVHVANALANKGLAKSLPSNENQERKTNLENLTAFD